MTRFIVEMSFGACAAAVPTIWLLLTNPAAAHWLAAVGALFITLAIGRRNHR